MGASQLNLFGRQTYVGIQTFTAGLGVGTQ
jgi:hypothetical protein